MQLGNLKRLLRSFCPSPLWNGARACRDYLRLRLWLAMGWPGPQRAIRTWEELDRELDRVTILERESYDAFIQAMTEFYFESGVDLPPDPMSPEYAAVQAEFYRRISGRDHYQPEKDELFEANFEELKKWPFPYGTRSSKTVGEQLMAIGFLIRVMAADHGRSILEFGPGWGKTTIEFAQMGYRVTAVDVNPGFLNLIRERTAALGVEVQTVCSDMLKFQSETSFDHVVFYECFHHCSDHIQLIKQLDGLVARGGSIIFAGEPINDEFPEPWGVRRDGQALWFMRRYGWLELGFNTQYFRSVMAHHGWSITLHTSKDVPWQRVYVAKRFSEIESPQV